MWVPIESAREVENLFLRLPGFGYDFAVKKSKIRRRFKKGSAYVAFFINYSAGVDHFEVRARDTEEGLVHYRAEPEEELDWEWFLAEGKKLLEIARFFRDRPLTSWEEYGTME